MDNKYSYKHKHQREDEQTQPIGKKDLFEWTDVIITAIIAVVIIFTFVFKVVTIDGNSMKNTLFNGDKVIITNMFYEPKRGDIVVISRNIDNSLDNNGNEPIIKRIIATEGQTVDINFETGVVYVDGIALD